MKKNIIIKIISCFLMFAVLTSTFSFNTLADKSLYDFATDTDAEKTYTINYNIDDSVICVNFESENQELIKDYKYFLFENQVIVGWQSECKKYYYSSKNYISTNDFSDNLSLDLKPIYCDVLIQSDDVYSFSNSRRIFTEYGRGYTINPLDFAKFVFKSFIKIIIPKLGSNSSTYLLISIIKVPFLQWNGSCYGMSLSVLLNALDKIDICKELNSNSVSSIKPDFDAINLINYYHLTQYSDYYSMSKSGNAGTETYRNLTFEICDLISYGEPVVLNFKIKELEHSIVVTGIYTDNNDNINFIYYDPNNTCYSCGTGENLIYNLNDNTIYFNNTVVDSFKYMNNYKNFCY